MKHPTSKHHIRRLHIERALWFSVLTVGLLIIQVAYHFQAATARPMGWVLPYTTSVSREQLLSDTNAARAANGKPALTLNAKLNNGAQAKAEDMAAKNYWSHNAPDGTEPWAFFTQAGYIYKHAGENLAYGFKDGSQIVPAWMNSAGHRANILGEYQEVGFGMKQSANYQGFANTVVVAFYGTPFANSPPAASSPDPVVAPISSPAPEPEKPQSEPPAPEKPQEEAPKEPSPDKATTQASPEAKQVTTLDTTLTGQANWAIYASLGFVGVTSLGFAATHTRLIRHGWRESRHFILLHPALDAAVVAGILALIFTQVTGFIR